MLSKIYNIINNILVTRYRNKHRSRDLCP